MPHATVGFSACASCRHPLVVEKRSLPIYPPTNQPHPAHPPRPRPWPCAAQPWQPSAGRRPSGASSPLQQRQGGGQEGAEQGRCCSQRASVPHLHRWLFTKPSPHGTAQRAYAAHTPAGALKTLRLTRIGVLVTGVPAPHSLKTIVIDRPPAADVGVGLCRGGVGQDGMLVGDLLGCSRTVSGSSWARARTSSPAPPTKHSSACNRPPDHVPPAHEGVRSLLHPPGPSWARARTSSQGPAAWSARRSRPPPQSPPVGGDRQVIQNLTCVLWQATLSYMC